jgi:beta-lactamase class A
MRYWLIGVGVLLAAVVAVLAAYWPSDGDGRPTRTDVTATTDAPQFTDSPVDPDAARAIQAIESRVGGRLGVMLVSPDDRLILANRRTERFPICSTFKLPLAVMILSDVDAGTLRLDRKLSLGDREAVENSPTIERLKRDGATEISVADALAAMMTQSDNSAANLLLTLVGDNSGYSQRIERAFGNDAIRMDRSEGVLNEDASRREDTATPDAMVAVLARVLHGTTLSPASRDRLSGWMAQSRTGAARVRAGLPDWLDAGDKTGTCTRTYNSVGWIDVGGDRKPYLYAVYLDETDASEDAAEAALADVGRLFGRIIERQFPAPETGRAQIETP